MNVSPDGYTGLVIAMASGWFGSTFFMLALMQSNIENASEFDVRDLWSYRMILLRCSVGVGAAAILYFFFESGLLGVKLWPDLNNLGFTRVDGELLNLLGDVTAGEMAKKFVVPNENTALLIIWSFLAGYSQTLVPNILIRTERSSTED